MTIVQSRPPLTLPDHTQLPESDGSFVFAKRLPQEHPQSLLLSSSIAPTLDALHPDARYTIGQDCGIYWRLTEPPERGAEAPDWFYAIYEVEEASVEVYQLIGDHYQQCVPNDRGHYPIPSLGVELGIWQGRYMHQSLPWLRWWDAEGNLLLAGDERAQKEAARSEKLAAKLRELGVNPDDL
jgi:hypothetical protein